MLPNSASEFWSRLSPRSSGNRRVSDSTACIKKPVNPSTDKDTTEFVPTSSGDQIHRSKILETNSNSTSSSGMDHQARASGSPLVLDSPAKASGSSLKTSRSTLVSGIPVKASGSPVEASGSPVGASGSPVVLGSPVGATSPPAKGTRSPARISDLESLCPSPQKIKETLAPHVGTHEQSIEIEAQKRLVVPANVPIFSNKSRAGKERDPLVCDNATSMHNGHRESTPTSFLDIVDNLQCPQNTGNPKPAGSISPASRNPANTDTGWHSGFLPADSRRHLPTPSEPSQISEDNKSPSSAKATSHPSQPLSITPPTAPKSHRVQHLKSHSAEASEFHPRLPPTGPKNHRVQHLKSYSAEAPIYRPMLAPSMPTTPTCTYGNGHRRSASIKMMQSNPSFSSPRRTRPRRQPRVGTPSFSGGSGRFQNPGPPHLLTGSHYPAPRQHTPQGQGQYFATSGSTPYQMATQIRQPVDRNMAPLPSPMFPSSMPPSDFGTPRINAHGYGQDEENVEYSQINHFDSYATPQAASAAPNGSEPQQNGSIYTQDTNGYGPTYYTNHTDPTHQVNSCPLRADHAGLIKN